MGLVERSTLRMALDAGVVGTYVIHTGRIRNIVARRVIDVDAPGTVAALAANVPLRDLFGLNVVINRVAAVASWPGRSLEIVGRIERFPPVGSLWNKILKPLLVAHVPLRGLRKIIVADFGEIALLPNAP